MLNPKIKKILKTVTFILIAIFLVIFLGFYRPVQLWGDTRYEPVYTGSMEPAIPVGSVVVIKPANPDTLKVGDIICFKIEGESSTTVTHRIINITDEGFITKGDANEDLDQWIVKKENIIGKVIAVIPYLGYLGYFVRTPVGFTLLIVIPASLLIILEIRNIIKELKPKSQY
ncbi:signal peptidase I [Candidatus Bathyarchaeota archaeon]|nr:signal peptidase I [Candidatus Bathyarchaeota archaeon]